MNIFKDTLTSSQLEKMVARYVELSERDGRTPIEVQKELHRATFAYYLIRVNAKFPAVEIERSMFNQFTRGRHIPGEYIPR